MKLWYSTTSPYVRKVLVTLKYQQFLDKTELIKIGSSFDASSLQNFDDCVRLVVDGELSTIHFQGEAFFQPSSARCFHNAIS